MMTQVTVRVGGREFDVACRDGEEPYLKAAAALLDAEADTLLKHMGRMPETTMLLMSGLMLADKTAAQQDRMERAEAKLHQIENRPPPEPERIEIPFVPPQVERDLDALAERAEALAKALED